MSYGYSDVPEKVLHKRFDWAPFNRRKYGVPMRPVAKKLSFLNSDAFNQIQDGAVQYPTPSLIIDDPIKDVSRKPRKDVFPAPVDTQSPPTNRVTKSPAYPWKLTLGINVPEEQGRRHSLEWRQGKSPDQPNTIDDKGKLIDRSEVQYMNRARPNWGYGFPKYDYVKEDTVEPNKPSTDNWAPSIKKEKFIRKSWLVIK